MTDHDAPAVPRPEYPRPQFVRVAPGTDHTEWLSLNGEWEFSTDTYDQGLRRGWQDGRALPRKITVPFAYQTELSGIADKGLHQVAWYARDLTVSDAWLVDGRDLLLHFGAVDYRTTVWINGREVGHNVGGHVPFWFDVRPYLQAGVNRVTVRAEDPQDGHQPRGKQSVSGQSKGVDYHNTTGIWQSAWLESAPAMRIDDLRLTPVLEDGEPDRLEVQALLHAPALGWTLGAEVLDGEEVVARAVKKDAGSASRLVLTIPGARRWSPDSPFLYGLRVRLLAPDGTVQDEVRSYAGIRDVRIRGGRLLLNGEPVYLKMALDQGYWPDGGMTAPTDDALRADVEFAKAFGFNGVRKHQKVEDPRWLYWCDRLGLLVWGEMANARAWSPRAEEVFLAEWERAVRRDYSHPCIVAWVPVNESWGVPDLREDHPGQYAFLERVVALTRRLDPTRPVIDNDGWEHTDVTDIVALHDYTPTAAGLRDRYADALAGGALPAHVWGPHKRRHFAAGSRFHGQPVMLTEVGGFLLHPPDLSRDQWDPLYDAYASISDPSELLAKYEDLMEGIASLGFVSGFCYTQLTDVEQEINGLLTYDRKPKVDPAAVARIHEHLFPGRHDG